MKLIIEESVTVITPTTGNRMVNDAVESVRKQTHKNITHLLVVDGPECEESFLTNIDKSKLDKAQVVYLPNNTGGNGFNGQRIYAAFPHLVDSDYVLFLDEDNWFNPDHVATLIAAIKDNGWAWAYSLRNIYTKDKTFVAQDNCESLGSWPIFWSLDKAEKQYIIDTSCYCWKRDFIKQTCHLWHNGVWGEDRRYYAAIRGYENYGTTGMHTSCYRLDDDIERKYGDINFFKNGNDIVKKHYGGKYPWAR